jgi:arginyl-tRNA synthetase
VFSWEKMLSFQGNTAPYLQNAYVRIHSIFRKSDAVPATSFVRLDLPEERTLALRLLQFGETVPTVLEEFRPNLLANYLFELANSFHSFYEKCPVLRAEEGVRESRLTLCNLSARVLSQGLSLLGIHAPERM